MSLSVFVSVLLIGIGLSMDAFAVSICKGLAMPKMRWRNALLAGVWFGGFQTLMPILGYFLGSAFAELVASIDHWIAFFLLALIGANMIRESRSQEQEAENPSFDVKTMLLLAIATSIDALAVGVSFAFSQIPIFQSALVIGCTTFVFGVAGIAIGHVFGARYKSRAEFVGGAILILMGLKILLSDLGVLPF